MDKLIKGLQRFRAEKFAANQELYKKLAQGQNPEVLFITCSDSRILPNTITSSDPGDLFVLRNIGNIVPPYGSVVGGESATIEFAIEAMGVKEVIVCGHTSCGAMKGLLFGQNMEASTPCVRTWLQFAETTKRLVKDKYPDEKDPETLVNIAAQENVLLQLIHLETHPAVASAISRGKITLYGWMLKIDTCEIYAFDSDFGYFRQLAENVKSVEEGRLWLTNSNMT